jgi:ribosomal-protein-serine acetyltransferase
MSHFFAPECWVTPEFTIRCFRSDDGQMLHDAMSASSDHLRPFLHWKNFDATPEDRQQSVRSNYSKYLTNTDFIMGVFSPDNTRLIGWTAFLMRGRKVEEGTAEIGMWIAASEAGKGLGTRVLKELLKWGFTEWPWVRMEWWCDTLNLASAAVARKGGLQLDATLRQYQPYPDGTRHNIYVFSILRDEYRPDEG